LPTGSDKTRRHSAAATVAERFENTQRRGYSDKRARPQKYESNDEGDVMGGNFVRWLGLGVAVGMGLQPAQAGDRKNATFQRVAMVAHGSSFGGQMRSLGNNHVAAPMKMQGRGELAFVQFTPFELRSAGVGEKTSRPREEQKGSGPTTAPRERRTITLLRLNPNISVQPVVGGVNGAQLSVGF
jgi:hypothetical protein